MAVPLDFPASPTVGQRYTSSFGVTYEWNGFAWVVGLDPGLTDLTVLGGVLNQVRVLLQDTLFGNYRYPTDQLIANLNQGMMEMFRIRPDLFLANAFVIPQFAGDELDAPISIEQQYIPPLIYFTVGLTQARDDEETQDARATGFMQRFSQMLREPV